MNILDYFDPHNIEHIRAYKHLQETGRWPDGFIVDDIEMPTLWAVSLASIMTDCWINEILSEEREFVLHWLDGKTETIKGSCIADAFSDSGIGHGALEALDYWEEIK